MSEHRVIIEHPDGRRYSVTPAAHRDLYEADGFAVVGEETPADFIATGIPAPKRPRRRPTPKRVAPTVSEPEG
ncbi:MAG: hypothetical protein ACYDCI_05795 [Candidatus Limnocylindrales bacterium]